MHQLSTVLREGSTDIARDTDSRNDGRMMKTDGQDQSTGILPRKTVSDDDNDDDCQNMQ